MSPVRTPQAESTRAELARWMGVGNQAFVSWPVGDESTKPILDCEPGPGFRRVSVVAPNVALSVRWGTSRTLSLDGLRSPLVASFPGRIYVEGTPLNGNGAEATCALCDAASPGVQIVRSVVTSVGSLGPFASRVSCVTAGQVAVDGIVVALAVGETLRVAGPTAVISGAYVVEYEL